MEKTLSGSSESAIRSDQKGARESSQVTHSSYWPFQFKDTGIARESFVSNYLQKLSESQDAGYTEETVKETAATMYEGRSDT